MAKLNSKMPALLIVAGALFCPIMSLAQPNNSKTAVVPSDSQKTKKAMEKKIVVGKIEVPARSIEAFRKQVHVTPNFLKTLPGYVAGEMYEMTDDAGTLHVLSITTWEDDESYKDAQKKLTAFYKETNFDRMAFREKLSIAADYALYTETLE
jgi:heme-degrading monooxygenase HmoA